MVRKPLCVLLMALLAGPALADAAGDLKAGLDAAKSGRYDEAITALTSALAGGTLSTEDQSEAARARGDVYLSKSLMSDAFDRRDEARRLRETASADLTRALELKPNDPALLAERGRIFYVNRQYDAAVNDFDAALRLKPSPITLMQRGNAYRGKGDYDRAVADYDQALAADLKGIGLEPWDIHVERGYADFFAGRFAAAATDFDKALTLGASAHAGDVLWAPYQVAWLHIARARAGQEDRTELAGYAEKMALDTWPGSLIGYFLGRRSMAEIGGSGGHAVGRSRECNQSFFVGEDAIVKGDTAAAERNLRRAREVCNVHTITAFAAEIELKRIGK